MGDGAAWGAAAYGGEARTPGGPRPHPLAGGARLGDGDPGRRPCSRRARPCSSGVATSPPDATGTGGPISRPAHPARGVQAGGEVGDAQPRPHRHPPTSAAPARRQLLRRLVCATADGHVRRGGAMDLRTAYPRQPIWPRRWANRLSTSEALTTVAWLACASAAPRSSGADPAPADRLAGVARAERRAAADPPPVLRGIRRDAGRSMTGTSPPDPPSARSGLSGAAPTTSTPSSRSLLPLALILSPPDPHRPAPRASCSSMDRPRRRRGSGLPPRVLSRPGRSPFPDSGTVTAAAPPAVIPHLQPHPGLHDALKRRCPRWLPITPGIERGTHSSLRPALPGSTPALARQVVALSPDPRRPRLLKPGVAETLDWARAPSTNSAPVISTPEDGDARRGDQSTRGTPSASLDALDQCSRRDPRRPWAATREPAGNTEILLGFARTCGPPGSGHRRP